MKIIFTYIKKYKKEFVILFLLTLIISGISGVLPIISQAIFDQGILDKNIKLIIVFSILILFLQATKTFVEIFYEIKIAQTGNEIVMLEKNDVFNRIIKLPLAFFDKYSPQYILSRINEINGVSNLISPTVFSFVTSAFTAIVALGIIFYKNIYLGSACILFICVLYKVTDIYMGQMGSSSKKLYEQSAKSNHNMHNAIQGLFTIKNLNREDTIKREIERDIRELAKRNVQQQKTISKGSKITTGTILCIDIILTGIIAVLVVLNKLKLADYISLIQYVSLVFAPIVSLQSLKIIAKPVLVSLQRINEMIYEEGDSKKIEITEIQGIEQININNLNFSYSVEDEYILKEINLCLKPKDKLALIGHNGSGKTTLVKILLGYYEVGEDKVLINGIDINKIKKESLRQCIGFVPQNIFLFEMSVFENIRVGNTDMDVEEFSENLKKLQDCGFLEGIDMSTVIIDNGKNLSKGQIQQIAIARTLVKTHSLYIFDEATSYLDKAAKSALYDLLKNKIKKEICIFICHDNDFDDITNKEFILQ